MEDRVNWPKWSPFAKTYDPLQSGSIDGTDTTPHDRALIRAMEAKYVPPNKNVATPDAEKTLFVGRLDHKTSEENLKHEFSRYGTITHCRIVKDVVTGFSRGYAFVQFKHLEDAEKARRDAHRAVLDGREILVEWENGRTMPGWIPRRLGGGFGGKKESGQLRFGGRDRPFRKPIVIKPLRSTNLEEDDARPSHERDRRPPEEESEKNSSRTEYSRDSRDGRFLRKDFDKPWDRSLPGSSRGGRSWRDREEDRRYSNDWDSHREKSRNYSKRDWNERDDYYGRSSWDRKEDRRYSDKSSRDREEDRKSSRDRNEWEDPNEKEKRKSYWDRGNIEQLDENQGRSRKVRDQEDSRSDKKSKSSRRSRNRDDSSVRVKEEKLSPNERDMGEWEDTPEREERRLKRSPKDEGEESADESKHKKRSKRSRDRSDTEDDGRERKSKKKKKRSKKSRDYENSDDSYEKRKEKKKKHKKSRD